MSVLNMFRSGLVAPSETTYDSMSELLNENDPDEKNRLTEQWRDHKLQELNFIGVVVGNSWLARKILSHL